VIAVRRTGVTFTPTTIWSRPSANSASGSKASSSSTTYGTHDSHARTVAAYGGGASSTRAQRRATVELCASRTGVGTRAGVDEVWAALGDPTRWPEHDVLGRPRRVRAWAGARGPAPRRRQPRLAPADPGRRAPRGARPPSRDHRAPRRVHAGRVDIMLTPAPRRGARRSARAGRAPRGPRTAGGGCPSGRRGRSRRVGSRGDRPARPSARGPHRRVIGRDRRRRQRCWRCSCRSSSPPDGRRRRCRAVTSTSPSTRRCTAATTRAPAGGLVRWWLGWVVPRRASARPGWGVCQRVDGARGCGRPARSSCARDCGTNRWPLLAVAAVKLSGVLDNVDGAVAVMTRRATALGYVVDSVVDRIGGWVAARRALALGAPLVDGDRRRVCGGAPRVHAHAGRERGLVRRWRGDHRLNGRPASSSPRSDWSSLASLPTVPTTPVRSRLSPLPACA